MALLKRIGVFGTDTCGAEIARAASLEELLSAYKLTHDLFVQQGYIQPHPSGIRLRRYEALPETATFVGRKPDQVVGVTTVVVDTGRFGIPANGPFGQEIKDALTSQGRTVCEGTNWLVAPEYRRSAILGELMRASLAYAMYERCDDFLACVSPGHAKFYEVLGFELLGTERSYSRQIDDPVVLMRLDVRCLRDQFVGEDEEFLNEYWIDTNPYHTLVPEWCDKAVNAFKDPNLLRELFLKQTGFLSNCPASDREQIAACWGRELYDRVFGQMSTGTWSRKRSA
jgi:hypothetical protein